MIFTPGNDAKTNNQLVAANNSAVLREAPQPPFNRSNVMPENFNTVRFEIVRDDNEFLMFEPERDDDFTFERIHEELGRPILLAMSERRVLKEKAEVPLIVL